MHLSSSHVFISSWANIHHDGIERMHSASARICTALATWSSGFFNKTKLCRRVGRVMTSPRPLPRLFDCRTSLADISLATDLGAHFDK